MTVRDNLKMVPAEQSGERLIDAWFRPSVVREEEQRLAEKAQDVIQFLQLDAVADEVAGRLSGGQKKLLARALGLNLLYSRLYKPRL